MKIILRFFILAIVIAIIVLGVGGYTYHQLKLWGTRVTPLEQVVVIDLKKGSSLREFSKQLESAQLIDKAIKFEVWTRLFSSYSRFQAGPYRFKNKVSPRLIARKVIKGDVYRPVVFKITIPEGFTYKQFAARMQQQGVGDEEEFKALFTDKDLLSELNVPSTSLEGFLYPATYSFIYMPTAKDVIRKSVKTFYHNLPDNYVEHLAPLGINLLQAVTIASLIELETPQRSEKPLISEVIWRRLKASMPLGIDAAIIYGIPDYNGNISAKHLADATNPYNTRIHKGLPPTPIGSPALDSLMAVIHYADAGNYYFVVDPDNPKRHIFSKNFKEHSKNVRKYVAAIKRR